jgi:succinate-semialdehyde dehydrogenase/glutarate-semialdehyde dehydrogenase
MTETEISSAAAIQSINPATGEVLQTWHPHSDEEIDLRLTSLVDSARRWAARSLEQRAEVLRTLAAEMTVRRDALARIATLEMGKPIVQAEAEIDKCARSIAHFADRAAHDLAPELVATDAEKSYVRYEPLGVVLAVMPWNFPFWQVFRCAAPALMAGNVIALKHASSVSGCAVAIEARLDEAARLPVLEVLLVPGSRAAALVDRPEIHAVAVTGSEPTGRAVAARAGAALKKTVLELGGSDPFVVLADADLQTTLDEAVFARIQNNGQSCIAAKRFIVEESVADAFTTGLQWRFEALRVGDPLDRTTQVGPLARLELRDELDRQVRESIARGARLVTGGHPMEGRGAFYRPTVLADVAPGMPAFDEETFGPVAPVIRARDAEHALELANHSRYGLGASVWTQDAARGEAFAARLQAGATFVNGIVRSDPRLPFGGVKNSGYGRELGVAGLREFVNVKSVWIR